MWSVGSSFDGTDRHTLAERWTGGSWNIVATPDGPQPNSFLTAVDSKGAGNVWAVGFSASANPFDPQSTTLVETWSGTSWSVVDSPNPTMPGGGESTDELFGVAVAGPGDVWAVGKTADFSDSQSLILHWDGVQWTDMSTADDGPAGWLTAIEVVAPDDIWAVGFDSVDFVQVNLIKHWDGQHWTNVEAPNVGSFVNQLQSVSATSKDDVWAVGFHLALFGVDQVNQTSILHWNGSVWSVVDSPNRSQKNNELFGVVGTAAGSAWAVGFWDNGVQILTLIQHWDGLTWNVISGSPNASDAINQLTGVVSVGPNEAWAVGQDAEGPTSKPSSRTSRVRGWSGRGRSRGRRSLRRERRCPDLRHLDDATRGDRGRRRCGLYRGDERADHLRECDEAEAPRALARRREPLENPVERDQRIGPAVARPEHVPRAQDGGREAARAQDLLSLRARLPVRLHGRRRMRHADVDEVRDPRRGRRLDGRPQGGQVDRAEERSLRRARVRHADELEERVARRDAGGKAPRVERVPRHRLAAGGYGEPRSGLGPRQRAHGMAAREEPRDHPAAEVARGSRDEDVASPHRSHPMLLLS